MHYYLYQITNKVNNKIYVGVHKTKNLDDGYMGSGKVIRRAIEKHGIENFEKVILETFENSEAMYAREKEVVNEDFLARDDVYNLRRGGYGGFDHINREGLSVKTFYNSDIAKGAAIKGNAVIKFKIAHDPLFAAARLEQCRRGGRNSTHGIPHTEKTKEKLKIIMRDKQKGAKNSQFGTMWISNGVESKKIKKTDQIPNGWEKGRI